MQQLQDVREDAHRGDVGAGARALHDERRARVALGRERDHVVAALGRGDGMSRAGTPSARPARARSRACRRSAARLPRAARASRASAISRVVARERRRRIAVENFPRAQRARHEAVHLAPRRDPSADRSAAPRISSFLRDVLARQIVARIGLGESHAMGVAHQRAERHAAVEGVEQVAERAGQDAFDLARSRRRWRSGRAAST